MLLQFIACIKIPQMRLNNNIETSTVYDIHFITTLENNSFYHHFRKQLLTLDCLLHYKQGKVYRGGTKCNSFHRRSWHSRK